MIDGICALDEKTLVLNRSWRAIHVTTVRRAISLVYQRVAKIIAPETFESHDFESWRELGVARGERFIRAVSFNIRVPEVIMLIAYDAVPRKEVPFSRRNIYRRDNFMCQYCGKRFATEDLSVDHVIPRSRGGKSTWANCVLACLECNIRKGNRTLDEADMSLIRQPHKPRWAPYLTLTLGYRKHAWDRFISEQYWNVELQE